MVDAELGEGAGERQPDGTGTHDQYIGTGRQGWHAVLLGWELVGLLDHGFPHRELTLSREQAGRVIEPSLSNRTETIISTTVTVPADRALRQRSFSFD
jgi:hypothetical protein